MPGCLIEARTLDSAAFRIPSPLPDPEFSFLNPWRFLICHLCFSYGPPLTGQRASRQLQHPKWWSWSASKWFWNRNYYKVIAEFPRYEHIHGTLYWHSNRLLHSCKCQQSLGRFRKIPCIGRRAPCRTSAREPLPSSKVVSPASSAIEEWCALACGPCWPCLLKFGHFNDFEAAYAWYRSWCHLCSMMWKKVATSHDAPLQLWRLYLHFSNQRMAQRPWLFPDFSILLVCLDPIVVDRNVSWFRMLLSTSAHPRPFRSISFLRPRDPCPPWKPPSRSISGNLNSDSIWELDHAANFAVDFTMAVLAPGQWYQRTMIEPFGRCCLHQAWRLFDLISLVDCNLSASSCTCSGIIEGL